MKLFYRKYGEGTPLIILHGLFGQCDNWQSQAKIFADNGYEVYAVDQRNHGSSPHSDEFNYKVMSADVAELVDDLNLNKINILGHSMGGKTALQMAIDYPEKIQRLIVADIGLRYFPPHQQNIIDGLKAINFDIVKTRRQAEEILSGYISDFGTKQFLLKNIFWKSADRLDWRFNLSAIEKNIQEIGAEIVPARAFTKQDFKTLFIRGENSNYIEDADIPAIRVFFPDADFVTIEGAAHWLHADKPKEFATAVLDFLNS